MAGLNRRQFLGSATAAVAGAATGAPLARAGEGKQHPDIGPVDKRALGKTGREVSLLALGLGSRYTIPFREDREAGHEILEQALAMGVNYFDTAASYGPSEEMIGPVVKKHRKQIFLSSKSQDRSYDGFKREVETSLKKLQTDYLDNYHIHSIRGKDDDNLAEIEKNGAVKAARELKDQGVIRHFGVSGHSGADHLVEAIKVFEPDILLSTYPASRPDQGRYETELLPLAKKHNMGVMAMKSVRRARDADLEGTDLIRYPLSLEGITGAVVGLDSVQHLKMNARAATNFKPLDKNEMNAMSEQIRYALGDTPAPWQMPGYEDYCRA